MGAPVPDGGVPFPDEWDQPPRRPSGPGGPPVLAIDGFEGPLDWLLDLARTRRIDLARLSIAALVAAFEDALTAALATTGERTPMLGRWGDWLVMAAELTVLRSRLLVPPDPAAAQDALAAAERLRQRLLDRAAIVRAADWLDNRARLGRDVFGRGRTGAHGTARAGRSGDVTALLRACLVALRLPPEAGTLLRVPAPPFWSVADAVARIRTMLPGVGEGGVALERFLPPVPSDMPDRDRRCRGVVASTFTGVLELARDGSVAVQQEAAWEPVCVRLPNGAEKMDVP